MTQPLASNRKKGVVVFITVLAIFFCFPPYEFRNVYFPFIPDTPYFIAALTVLSAFLYFNSNGKKIPNSIIIISVVQILGLIIHDIHIGQNFFSSLLSICNIVFPLFLMMYVESTIGLFEFYRRYNKWILIMAILGTFVWIMVTFMGFSPLYYVPVKVGDNGYIIANYFLTFSKQFDIYKDNVRYSGFFDEPGAMGYWGLYALLINKLFIKNKKLETILAICLVFTFSFGYYVQLIVYVLLFYVNTKNIKRSLLYIGLIGALIGGFIMLKDTSYGTIYDQTIGRVLNAYEQSQENDELLNIDSRSGLTENAREVFLANPLFGSPTQAERVGNNIYETLAVYGLLGAPLVLFPFLFWLLKSIGRRDMVFLKALLVIIVGFTHRPFHVNLLSIFILYSIIFMYLKYGINKENV